MGKFRPERLTELRKEHGLSQDELARRTKSTQPSINRLEAGGTERPRNLVELARELRTTPEYLLGETDDPSPSRNGAKRAPLKRTAPQNDDLVELDEIDLRYGLGASYIDGPVSTEKRAFSRAWLRNFTHTAPEHLFWTIGDGDSMEPTIRTGEVILIDASHKTPRMAEGIWAVAIGEIGMIKRLHFPGNGRVELHSDNKVVPPIAVGDEELHVVGRVVAVVRRL